MKTKILPYSLCLVLAIAFVFSGCVVTEAKQQKEIPCKISDKTEIFKGKSKTLGNGTIYSWVMLDSAGNPLAIGVNFSSSALEGLPVGTPQEYMIALPEEAALTAFDHIAVDWNPKGHEPQGIYDKPHFDVHFYMISPQERDEIKASKEDSSKLAKKPAPAFIPEGYAPTPGGVPRMGAHWIDPKAPEFNGKPFKATFIYGFYNGKMVFVEPMVTIAFLKTKPEMSSELKLPKCYPERGYYPTNYSISYNNTSREYSLALGNLTQR